MTRTRPTHSPARRHRFASLSAGITLAVAVACSGSIGAAPSQQTPWAEAVAQNVDYIGLDSGRALDLGFPVLVPSWVPSPFGGSPSVDAGGGYYSLYWMNGGGDPTFLQVTGTVGGSLPAGSPYDLNIELFINASVMGYDAIHDVTPAYDAVWWIAGGVLYKVESRNSGTDSLTLANSLISFVAPSAPEPTQAPVEPTPVPPQATAIPVVPTTVPADSSTGSDGSTVSTGAQNVPAAASNASSSNSSQSSSSQDGTSGASTTAVDAAEATADEDLAESDGTGQPFASSDGTGGPAFIVVGGDGTGGANDVAFLPAVDNVSATP